MRTLMITYYLPYPLQSGAAIRNYNLLKRLSRENEVWVAAFAEQEADAENIAHLKTFCAGVETVEMVQYRALGRPLKALEYFFRGWPMELRQYHSRELMERIRTLVTSQHFDVVEVEDSFMGLYLEALPADLRCHSILTFHDIVFNKAKRIASLEPRWKRKIRMWLYGQMMYRWEPFYMENYGRCIAMSETDRSLILSRNPRLKIDVVPNGVDSKKLLPISPSEDNPMILFVGDMDYRPNIDAATFFCREILPLVKKRASRVEVCIAGRNPPEEVLALAGDGIQVTGTVPDLQPYYARSTVCVVPLRAGGGTRLKILEAMALGRPVVSTAIGCEGLNVQDGQNIFIADSLEDFAARTLELILETNTRIQMTANGRKLVEQEYDWDVIAERLFQTYHAVASL
jgi:polysaccharide biosynthesis protein PslH